ncbi:MAG: alpha-amylase, partial [SAR86 cluster bacterium]
MNRLLTTALCASTLLFNNIALADEPGSGLRADSHAPISIMGDHMHNKGEWMTSYRFMSMDMQDNLSGSNRLSVEEIATTAANRFADVSGQPPTLRVVPTKMHTDMHMFGGMYAPSDNITLMVMASYLERDMDLTTFQGGMGIDRLGTFNTKTEGWGDVKVASLIRLYKDQTHQVHLNAGLSLP